MYKIMQKTIVVYTIFLKKQGTIHATLQCHLLLKKGTEDILNVKLFFIF